jgi:hypothetical protein
LKSATSWESKAGQGAMKHKAFTINKYLYYHYILQVSDINNSGYCTSVSGMPTCPTYIIDNRLILTKKVSIFPKITS